MAIRDGSWELVKYDFQTKQSVWSYFDGEKTVYRIDTPVEETVKMNSAVRNANSGARWGDGQLIASIPGHIYHAELGEAARAGDDKHLKRWLNSSENAHWRTFEGQV